MSLEPNNLDGVWSDIRRVGDALGVSQRANELIASLTQRLAEIRERTSAIKTRPRVAAIEWLGPLMAGGNWMPELIEIAGGRSLFAQGGEHSTWLDWPALVEADPEVILLLPCGFTIPQTIADLDLLTQNPAWPKLRAAHSGEVYLIDGHHFFNRPGPRLVESAEIVAEILHPDHFDFGHRGAGWIALADARSIGSRDERTGRDIVERRKRQRDGVHELLRAGAYEVVSLLTTVSEEYRRISHHGVRESLLDEQAKAIGLPLRKVLFAVRFCTAVAPTKSMNRSWKK